MKMKQQLKQEENNVKKKHKTEQQYNKYVARMISTA